MARLDEVHVLTHTCLAIGQQLKTFITATVVTARQVLTASHTPAIINTTFVYIYNHTQNSPLLLITICGKMDSLFWAHIHSDKE